MLGSDWRALAKVGGLGLAGLTAYLLVLFVGYQLGSSGGYFDAQADGYAAQYPSDTDKRIRNCFAEAQAPRDAQACVGEAIETSHESARSEKDLSAQRQMAHWAKGLLIITLAQFPLTAAGIILLLRTIWQGQESLKHAQNTARQQLRPYVLPLPFTIKRHEQSSDWWVVSCKVRNGGATPARNVTCYMRCWVFDLPLPRIFPDTVASPIIFAGIGPQTERTAMGGVQLSEEALAKMRGLEAAVVVKLTTRYDFFDSDSDDAPVAEGMVIGSDIDEGVVRVIPDWAYYEPPPDQTGQEQLKLPPTHDDGRQTPEENPQSPD